MQKNKTIISYGNFIVRYRWLVLFACLLVIISLAAGMKKLGFNSDYHVFFAEDNQDMLEYDRFQKVYSKEDNFIVVLETPDGVFKNKVLEVIQELVEAFWKVKYISRVDSLTNFQYTFVSGDDLLIEDFISVLPLKEEDLEKKKKIALNDPVIGNYLISKDALVTQINLRVSAPAGDDQVLYQVRTEAEKLIEKEKIKIPEVNFYLGGTVMISTSFYEFMLKDMQTLVPLMFVIIFVTLLVLFRSFFATIIPMFLIGFSVLMTLGIWGHLENQLTNVSSIVQNILIAVAVADSVHIIVVFFRGLQNKLSRNEAVIYTLERNLVPCFLTSFTTAIGFYSLIFQDVPPFQDLGVIGGNGVIFAFILSVTFLPALLALLPIRIPRAYISEQGYHLWTQRLADFVGRRKKIILWVSLLGSLFTILFLLRVKIDNNVIHFFEKGTTFRDAADLIDRKITGISPFDFSLYASGPDGVKDPVFLKKVEKFQDYLKSLPETSYASSVVDVIKRMNQVMHQNNPDYYRIPEDKNLIAQYFLLYTLSIPEGKDLTDRINIDYSQTRVTAFVHNISTWEQIALIEKIKKWSAENINGTGPFSGESLNLPIAVGVPVIFARLTRTTIPSFLFSIFIALIVVTITMVISFKSFKIGLFSMIPNVLPILLMFGTLGIAGKMVDMSVSMVGCIALGIAVDDTIHFLYKYLRGIREEKMDPVQATHYAFGESGTAIVYTSVILVAGFGILGFSNFGMNKNMGILVSYIITLALAADLFLLPSLILFLKKK